MNTRPGRSRDLTGDPSIRRILVIKWSAMGDVTLASAAMEDIRRAFPEAEMDLDTLKPWDGLFRNDPRFKRVQAYPLRSRGLWRQLVASVQWLRQVASRRYDLVIDLQTTDRSRFMIGALGLFGGAIRHRTGNMPAWPYTLSASHAGKPRHALMTARETLASVGIDARTERPVLHFSEPERAHARDLAVAHNLRAGEYAILLPGCQAAGYLKRWGVPRYADLARALLARGTPRVVILGGPDELDECAAIASRVDDPRVLDLAGKTRLADVPLLAEGAQFIIGNDTGTAHLAAAADRQMVVVCGPTDPRRVRPAGAHVRTVQLDIPCRNCYAKHCAHQSCMVLLSPDRVLAALTD